MTDQEKLKKSVSELSSLTGLSISVDEKDPARLPEAVRELSRLVISYKEKYNKTEFMRGVITGQLPYAELNGKAASFHIPLSEKRTLFVIETGIITDTANEILRNLLLVHSHDMIIPTERTSVILIKTMKEKDTEDEMTGFANMIVDMMSTEALLKVRVGISNPCTDLHDLAVSCREAKTALSVGRIFYSAESVFAYTSLGIGRLIHSLPIETCRLFLHEVFGEKIPDTFDQETVSTINTFFDNNLNISETARRLYLHRNTLVHRLEKMKNATGLDIRTFDDALTFKIASMIISYMKAKEDSCDETA